MICIPIVSANMSRALADIAAAEVIADIIELRVDLLDQPDLPALLKAASKPCIVTNRTKMEGGQFKGSEEQRVLLLRQAIDAGADYIDIESSLRDNLGSLQMVGAHEESDRPTGRVLLSQVVGDAKHPADVAHPHLPRTVAAQCKVPGG